MATILDLFSGNDQTVKIQGVADASGTPLSDATITATLVNNSGATVATLTFTAVVGSAGSYSATLSAAEVPAAGSYYLKIAGDEGGLKFAAELICNVKQQLL